LTSRETGTLPSPREFAAAIDGFWTAGGESMSDSVPNWAQKMEAIAALIAAVAAAIVLPLGLRQLDLAREEMAQLANQTRFQTAEKFYEEFYRQEMLGARAAAGAQYPEAAGAKQGSKEVLLIFNFFERLAHAKEVGIIGISDVDYYFLGAALCYWYGWQGWVREVRQEDPALHEGFESLVAELQEHGSITPPPSEALNKFFAAEGRLIVPRGTQIEPIVPPIPTSLAPSVSATAN
jgi:hypothetical protein